MGKHSGLPEDYDFRVRFLRGLQDEIEEAAGDKEITVTSCVDDIGDHSIGSIKIFHTCHYFLNVDINHKKVEFKMRDGSRRFDFGQPGWLEAIIKFAADPKRRWEDIAPNGSDE